MEQKWQKNEKLKIKKLKIKKLKKELKKRVLTAGFHIAWATNHSINSETQNILDSLTSLSLTKAFYSLFQPEHYGCWFYYCHLKHLVLRTLMDRRDNYCYLTTKTDLNKMGDESAPYPFYEEWLVKNNIY